MVPIDNLLFVYTQLNIAVAFKALLLPKNCILPAVPEAVRLDEPKPRVEVETKDKLPLPSLSSKVFAEP